MQGIPGCNAVLVSKIMKVKAIRDERGRELDREWDLYLKGMYNGLEVALAVLEDREIKLK